MDMLKLMIIVVVVSLLSACTVGPDYVRPKALPEIPATYKEVEGWKPARPGGEVIGEKWWELFNDPQLNALEEQVVVANQDVVAAEARFRQARALVRSAKAGYYPTVSLGASVTNSRASATMGGGTGRTAPPTAFPWMPPGRRISGAASAAAWSPAGPGPRPAPPIWRPSV